MSGYCGALYRGNPNLRDTQRAYIIPGQNGLTSNPGVPFRERLICMAKVCNAKGCPNIAVKDGRCVEHPKIPWEGRRGFEGYKGEYLKNRKRVLKEEPYCRACGVRPSTTVDHIVSKAEGGSDRRENLRGMCEVCHGRRSRQQATRGRKNIKY